jgi:hypothetical protein
MEKSNEIDSPLIASAVSYGFLILVFAALFGVPIWAIVSMSQALEAINLAPLLQATVTVTSKDTDQRLSIQSADLPKGGDVVSVDQFVYGAISSGDRICVQYKSISDDPQFATEFLNKGSCQK